MKYIFCLFLLLPMVVFCQLPTKEGRVFYEFIDSVEMPKPAIYNKAKLYFINRFNDFKSIAQLDDSASGEMIGKGGIEYNYTYKKIPVFGVCNFTFSLSARDGKYRLRFYNLTVTSAGITMPIEPINRDYKNGPTPFMLSDIDAKISLLAIGLKQAVISVVKDDF